MLIVETDKAGLIDYVSGNGHRAMKGRRTDDLWRVNLSSSRIGLVWPDDGDLDDMPSLVICAEGGVIDFLAWASTYLGSLRPFTAFCRVCDTAAIRRFKTARPKQKSKQLEATTAALITAEALTYGRGQLQIESLNLAACGSTFSFVASKMLLDGMDEDITEAFQKWRQARSLLSQKENLPGTESVIDVWSVVRPGFRLELPTTKSTNFAVSDAYRELVEHGELSTLTWDRLNGPDSPHELFHKEMRGTRERRVLEFEKLANRWSNRKDAHTSIGRFILGYAASRLDPGALSYVELVSLYEEQFPGLLMWYALCASVNSFDPILNAYDGLGRRILRDVQAHDDLVSRPRCDIAVDELQVMVAAKAPLDQIRVNSKQFVTVEVWPTVTSSVRTGFGEHSNRMEADIRSPPPPNAMIVKDLRRLIAMFTDTVDKLALGSNEGETRRNEPTSRKKKKW